MYQVHRANGLHEYNPIWIAQNVWGCFCNVWVVPVCEHVHVGAQMLVFKKHC